MEDTVAVAVELGLLEREVVEVGETVKELRVEREIVRGPERVSVLMGEREGVNTELCVLLAAPVRLLVPVASGEGMKVGRGDVDTLGLQE